MISKRIRKTSDAGSPIPIDVLDDISDALSRMKSYPSNAYGHREAADILSEILEHADYSLTMLTTIQAKECE